MKLREARNFLSKKMSIFQGKLQEYPFIAIDNFTAETLDCTAFFLSHCHTDHMEGLASDEFFQRLKSNKMVHLYCSETTKNLMRTDERLLPLCQFTRDIPVNQPTVLTFQGDEEEKKTLVVTLIPAGHCVGSVMFFFEGDQEAVLYTGDFRLQKGDIKRVPCLKTGESVKKIRGLYVDTTFCNPLMEKLPKREDTRDAMVKLMSSWLRKGSNYAVYIQCSGKYGYEYILKEVAKAFNMKVHLDEEKCKIYSGVASMTEYSTMNKFSTRIHSCRWRAKRSFSNYLPCGISNINGLPVRVMTIKPSTLWFAKRKSLPEDHISYDKRQGTYRVLHSMHSSYEEIRDLVAYIRPKYIYPTVTPVNSNDILEAYDWLKDLLRSKDDGDDSLEAGEKQGNADNQNSKDQASNNTIKNDWKLGIQNKAILSPKRAKTFFADLGIENETDSPPKPSSRRNSLKRKQKNEDGNDMKKGKELSTNIDKENDLDVLKLLEEDDKHEGTEFVNSSKNDYFHKTQDDSFNKSTDDLRMKGEKLAGGIKKGEGLHIEKLSKETKTSLDADFAVKDTKDDIYTKRIETTLDEKCSSGDFAAKEVTVTRGKDIAYEDVRRPNIVERNMTGFSDICVAHRKTFDDEKRIPGNDSEVKELDRNVVFHNGSKRKKDTLSLHEQVNQTYCSDEFEIPGTPGYEGPSEEELHSFYLDISNGNHLLH